MYYWTCSRCGANLDPGEHCDCENEETPERLPYATGVKRKKCNSINHRYYSGFKGGLSTWQE